MPGFKMKNIRNVSVLVLATGFGLGLSPVASGTAGSLLGVAITVGVAGLTLGAQVCLAVILALIAVPVCDAAEKIYGRKDDGRIVADEYLTFIICTLGLPWQTHLWLLPVAFVTNRIMDVIKPFPARRIQEIRGGAGIVLDDVVSSLYALGINWIIYYAVTRMVA